MEDLRIRKKKKPNAKAPGAKAPGVQAAGGVKAPGAKAARVQATGEDPSGVKAAGVKPAGVKSAGVKAAGVKAPGVKVGGAARRGGGRPRRGRGGGKMFGVPRGGRSSDGSVSPDRSKATDAFVGMPAVEVSAYQPSEVKLNAVFDWTRERAGLETLFGLLPVSLAGGGLAGGCSGGLVTPFDGCLGEGGGSSVSTESVSCGGAEGGGEGGEALVSGCAAGGESGKKKGLVLSMSFQPSDPDVPSDVLFPEGGLQCRLAIESEEYIRSGWVASWSTPELLVSDEDIDPWVRRVIRWWCRRTWPGVVSDPLKRAKPVLNLMFALDRDLFPLLIEAAERKAASTLTSGPWRPDEQGRLESALVYYRDFKEPKKKWKSIADFVATRTEKQCYLRYQECCEVVAQRTTQQQPPLSGSGPDDLANLGRDGPSSVSRGGAGSTGHSSDDHDHDHDDDEDDDEDDDKGARKGESSSGEVDGSVLEEDDNRLVRGTVQLTQKGAERGQSIQLRDLATRGLAMLYLHTLDGTCVCGKCGKRLDVLVSPAKPNSTGQTLVSYVACGSCFLSYKLEASSEYLPAESPGGDCGRFVMWGTKLIDAGRCSFSGTCMQCGCSILFSSQRSGQATSRVCKHCHNHTSLEFGSLHIEGQQPQFSFECAIVGGPKTTSRPKRDADDFKLVVGQPLPKEGTCTHYKKSHRWFRFPCCMRAFPCDRCHDAATDHQSDGMASRVICGYCSREHSAHLKDCVCGNSYVATRTSHWEGGKGCRDWQKMSKGDPRKFKLMKKQMEGLRKARKTT